MHIPERFHLINDWLCFVVGGLANAVLLWLLARRTTAQMATYRPVLLLTALADILCLTTFAVVTPVLVLDSGAVLWLAVGPLRQLPQPYGFAMLALCLYSFQFSFFSLAVPFVYRYFCICRGKNWGTRHFLAMLLMPLALCIGHLVFFIRAGYTRTTEDQRKGVEFLGINDSTTYRVIPFYSSSDSSSTRATYMMVVLLLTYSLVFLCAWRIYRHLTEMAEGRVGDDEYRSLQLQLSSALLLQSLPPLALVFTPIVGVSIVIVSKAEIKQVSAYQAVVHAWLPVLNPLIVIWVVHTYRFTVRMWLKGLNPTTWSMRVTTVAPAYPLQPIAGAAVSQPLDE